MDKGIFDLTGKIVVVTGGAGLLGVKHAEAVAEYGAIPLLIDLLEDKAIEQSNLIKERFGVDSMGMGVDITNEKSVANACDLVLKQFGKVDVLINNAANNPKVDSTSGIKNSSRLENFPLEDWNKDLAVGLTGAFMCAKYFGSAISSNEKGGSIINISSDLGIIAPDQRLYRKEGLPNEKQTVKPVTYSVIKSGLIGLTKYLATYWPGKVRSNALCPGGVEAGQGEDFLRRIEPLIPLGRMAKPDEYKGAIVFLSSNASSYMNGAVISIDGGRTVW